MRTEAPVRLLAHQSWTISGHNIAHTRCALRIGSARRPVRAARSLLAIQQNGLRAGNLFEAIFALPRREACNFAHRLAGRSASRAR